MRYVPVLGKRGVLGCLWASAPENAASFEPQDYADDEHYEAGLVWRDRLRSAADRGLSPLPALTELTRLPEEGGSGRVTPSAEPMSSTLASLKK
ncbi:hypothetical protein [Streptomyces sp. NPDC059802]|uniref:hypothetical protein n=1 Tax=Streptomyces sp. NPDC059802 TaxID=3346952 RepID=UPI00365997AE